MEFWNNGFKFFFKFLLQWNLKIPWIVVVEEIICCWISFLSAVFSPRARRKFSKPSFIFSSFLISEIHGQFLVGAKILFFTFSDFLPKGIHFGLDLIVSIWAYRLWIARIGHFDRPTRSLKMTDKISDVLWGCKGHW